jgi:tetratricopeptide (TPR) repeat protein
MTKIFFSFVLFLFGSSVIAQSYSDGFKQGYKEGYCHRDVGCVSPAKSPGIPSPGKNDYNGGYNDGFAQGVKDKALKNSQNNSNKKLTTTPQNQSTYIDYNKMTKDVSNTIYNIGIEREQKKAAARNFYLNNIAFINSFYCSGTILCLNQHTTSVQELAKNNINLYYDKLTSGWMELEDYYFESDKLMNNYISMINRINQINQNLENKLNGYIIDNNADGYKAFINDCELHCKLYSFSYSVQWYQKNKRYESVLKQRYEVNFKNKNNGVNEKLGEIEFYNSINNFAINYVVPKTEKKEAVLDTNQYQNYYRIGKELYNQKQFEIAYEQFKKALEIVNKDSVHIMLAGCKYKLGEFEIAYTHANNAIQSNFSNYYAYYLRSLIEIELSHLDGALSDINMAIALGGNWAQYLIKRGDIKEKMADYQGALHDYNEALNQTPSDKILQAKIIEIKSKIK